MSESAGFRYADNKNKNFERVELEENKVMLADECIL